MLPLTLTAEVTVTGRRTFRNLAELENPAESLIGLADAASEGAVTARQLEGRPLSRPGEVLETVPGLVINQHSGEGKANQYYLRGFNLDHGTDFAVSVAGIPVNMPTHGHGQGWSDVNFLIPELVSGVQFKKGPYYAEEGDFSTAGAANINYVNALDRPLLRVSAGGDSFGRVLAAASPKVASGNFLFALETGRTDGPWETPENYRRLNTVVRYSQGDTRQGFALTFMGYDAHWTATDQVPERAIASGLISRFGSLDRSDGGETHRYTLSAEIQRSNTVSTTRLLGFAMNYALDLFSNFTYFLNDSINGDQFEQVDERNVFGVKSSHRRRARLFGHPFEHSMGVQLRHDRIGPLGLFATRQRHRLATPVRSLTKKRPAAPGSCRMTLTRASEPALLPVPSGSPVIGSAAKSTISRASTGSADGFRLAARCACISMVPDASDATANATAATNLNPLLRPEGFILRPVSAARSPPRKVFPFLDRDRYGLVLARPSPRRSTSGPIWDR